MAGGGVGPRRGRPWPSWIAPAAAGAVSIVSVGRIVAVTSRFVTNADGTTLWMAGYEWAHGRWHEPAFYGQSYGSNLLGIPIAALHTAGVTYGTATPAVMAASTLVLWLALAAAFHRRGHPAVATVTAAVPALVATYYEFYVASVPYERLFAATGIGVALLIGSRNSRIGLAAGAALAGVGLAADTSALILVAPVAAWWVLDRRRKRAEWIAVGGGTALAAAYAVGAWWFYRAHPDHNLHGGLPLAPGWSRLLTSLGDPGPRFALFAPELLRSAWIPIGLAVAVTVIALTRRQARTVVPALLVVGVTFLALATPRALDASGQFLPPARALLALPPAICFLGFVVAESFNGRTWARTAGRWVIGAVAILLVVTGGVRVLSYDHGPEALLNRTLATPGYGFERVKAVRARCRELVATATRARADGLVLPLAGVLAEGCPPVTGTDLPTLDVPLERRTWVLEDAAADRATALLVADVPAGFCRIAAARFDACTRRGRDAIVRFGPRPTLDALAALDLPVRAFGPDCVVAGLTCSSGEDTRRRFPLHRGTPDPATRDALTSALDRFAHGDATAAEPGATGSVRRLARRLGTGRLTAGHWFLTGPDTAAVDLHLTGPRGSRRFLGQLVRIDGTWRVAATTRCALATTVGLACTAPVPGFLPGSTWR